MCIDAVRYSEIFCETVLLELAIAPTSMYTNVCPAAPITETDPDLSGLSLISTSPFYIPYGVYHIMLLERGRLRRQLQIHFPVQWQL